MMRYISKSLLFLISISILTVIFVKSSIAATALSWSSRASLPTPRYNFGLVSLNDKVYALPGRGGVNGAAYIQSVAEYDPVTDAWTIKASIQTSRESPAVATVGGKIYVMGGSDSNGNYISSVEEYDPTTDSWTYRASMPRIRSFARAAVNNGKIYVFGGQDGVTDGGIIDVDEYDPATNSWTTPTALPTNRNFFSATTADNGKIYLIGGANNSGFISQVDEYDPILNSWTTKANIPTPRNSLAAALGSDGRIYVFGGLGNGFSRGGAIVEAYNPVNDSWTTETSMSTRRYEHEATFLNGKLYVMGGVNEDLTPPNNPHYLNSNEEATAVGVPDFTVTNISPLKCDWTTPDGHFYCSNPPSGGINAGVDPSVTHWEFDYTVPQFVLDKLSSGDYFGFEAEPYPANCRMALYGSDCAKPLAQGSYGYSTNYDDLFTSSIAHQLGGCSNDNGNPDPCEYEDFPSGEYRIALYGNNGNPTLYSQVFTVEPATGGSVTLHPTADSYIKQGSSNENEGASTFLRLQQSGHNRGLVKFDQSQIQTAVGSSQNYTARLQFTITDNGNNWGTSGRTIDLHRLTSDWAEGNGFIDGNSPANRGTGSGATWSCAVDTNITNTSSNCSPSWNMTNSSSWPFATSPTATNTITNNQSGVVEFDVTSDVQSFVSGSNQNYGWLLKKTAEGQSGKIELGSKESSNTPVLIITTN